MILLELELVTPATVELEDELSELSELEEDDPEELLLSELLELVTPATVEDDDELCPRLD